jgi:Ca2+-binding RTX toxin-like protein
MTLPTEAVTLAGSGLVFVNTYGPTVSDAYRSAVITAENFLQSHFTNSVTVGVDFNFQPLGAGFSAQNNFSETPVSYSTFTAALRAHATTADDMLAVNGLPAVDPSGGAGFSIPTTEARILGLAVQTNSIDDSVTLNSDLPFTFGQDAVGALEHEISEGVFGRTASLGFASTRWNPLDLFRFTATGQRDFTGGSDGVTTFFGVDAAHLSALAYHNSINAAGQNDGFDLGDWSGTRGDAFGPGGPNSPGSISATDLQVLDVLGWNPTGAPGSAFQPAPDEFASSLSDTARPFGQLAPGGSATGVLQKAGDHDLFAVQLQAGGTYTITETGQHGGGGSLADPFLTLRDAAGNVLATNDDITDGSNPDSRLVFAAASGGTFYVDAGGFVDGYTGSYRVSVSQSSTPTTGGGGQVLVGTAGNDTVMGGAGDDTITAAPGTGASYLRGGAGDDVLTGGAGFNDMNGNMGNDTLHGGSGDNWVVGGQGNDMLFGGGGTNLILGNLGNDTLTAGPGQDVLRGGQGDDSIAGGAGNDFISGDLGNDTESGGAGADLFHGSQNIGIDRVLDFNYAQGDRVELDPGTTFALSQVGSDTIIDLGGGNEMILVGVTLTTLPTDWIFEGTLSHL